MRIAMIGGGYVGLVSAACFAEFGIEVAVVENSPTRLAALREGRIPIYEPGLDKLVESNMQAGRLTFGDDIAAAVKGAEAVFIAVGTPPRNGDGAADMQYVHTAARQIANALTGYTVVVTKSTVPCGTSRRIAEIIRAERPDAEFDVASNPEFLREGSAIGDFMKPDRVIIGLITPDEGIIEIDGVDVLRAPQREREERLEEIGMLFQNGALFDSLSVWENVAFALLAPTASPCLSRAQARVRANDVLAQVGLDASVGDLYPSELSGGMQKRVGLARAIADRPEILFFDEPTTGLDPIMGAVIDGLIVDCVKRMGSTAIAITHDMASAQRIGDQAAMLYRGKLVWQGPASSLMHSGNPMVDQFTHGRREGPITMELRR